MRKELSEALGVILTTSPEAYAFLYGSKEYPQINGVAYFYALWGGTLLITDVSGLPFEEGTCKERILGYHIHEGNTCTGNEADPFADAKTHYNPENCPHPEHSGDLPPLFGSRGYALSIFYTDRFYPEEIIGKTIIIHDMPDDFRTQPSGDSGAKIACGEIKENV